MIMEELEFRQHADEALTILYRLLAAAADDYPFDVDYNGEVLTVEFENTHAKFLVSPRKHSQQICISARAKSYQLDWDIVEAAFVLGGSGETLKEVMEELISKQLGEEISL